MRPPSHTTITKTFWILPLAFYWFTACPTVGWIDAPYTAGLVNNLEFSVWVNNHNLFILLAKVWSWLVPVGEFHYRLNLFAGLLGALTVHFIFVLGVRLTGNLVASISGALALMFSHALWWHSTMLEVYTLNTALMALILLCVLQYSETRELFALYKAVFCFGLAISNHILMGLFAFAFLALFYSVFRDRGIERGLLPLKLCGVFLIGLELYIIIFVRELNSWLLELPSQPTFSEVASHLRGMLDASTGGYFKEHMFPANRTLSSNINWRLNYLFLWLVNYPSLFLPLGFVGAYAFWKDKQRRLFFSFFMVGLAAQAIWSANYLIWDMYAFALPVWVLFGVLGIMGFDHLWRKGRPMKKALMGCAPSILIGPLLYMWVPSFARQEGFWQSYFSGYFTSTLWNSAEYFANPNKRDYRLAQKISESILAQLPQDSHLFASDSNVAYPIIYYYQRVLRKRPDVEVHLLFEPTLTREALKENAAGMQALIDEGKNVFASSPFWPVSEVLGHLYLRLDNTKTPDDLRDMSWEEFERTFPRYRLNKIYLLKGEPYFIFKVEKRES